MKEFSFEILENLAVLSESEDKRFTTEVNKISFNGKDPKIDIRKWDKQNNKMLKGIALSSEEWQALKDLMIGGV